MSIQQRGFLRDVKRKLTGKLVTLALARRVQLLGFELDITLDLPSSALLTMSIGG